MTATSKIAIACCLLLLVAAACSKPGSNSASAPAATPAASAPHQRVTSESVVKVAAQPLEISAGHSAEAKITITIQSGYHVNANPPTFSYLKATQLDVPAGEGLSAASISYPSPVTRKFPFADKPLAVYEGQAEIKATLKAANDAAKGDHPLAAQLRVQACDEQVCYPPGQIDLRIPVTVK